MRKVLAAAFLFTCISGCAGWKPVDDHYQTERQKVLIQLPKGWMALRTGNTMMFTRDGLMLQRIAIVGTALSEKKQFSYTKKRITKGMLPIEIAEVIIDDLQSTTDIRNMTIEENIPTTLSDAPGCRITYTFRMTDGPAYRGILYGFLYDDAFYQLIYLAPRRHYFDRDLETFAQIAKSITIKDQKTGN